MSAMQLAGCCDRVWQTCYAALVFHLTGYGMSRRHVQIHTFPIVETSDRQSSVAVQAVVQHACNCRDTAMCPFQPVEKFLASDIALTARPLTSDTAAWSRLPI